MREEASFRLVGGLRHDRVELLVRHYPFLTQKFESLLDRRLLCWLLVCCGRFGGGRLTSVPEVFAFDLIHTESRLARCDLNLESLTHRGRLGFQHGLNTVGLLDDGSGTARVRRWLERILLTHDYSVGFEAHFHHFRICLLMGQPFGHFFTVGLHL